MLTQKSQRLTLEEARDMFRNNKIKRTATVFRDVMLECWADGELGDQTLLIYLREIKEALKIRNRA